MVKLSVVYGRFGPGFGFITIVHNKALAQLVSPWDQEIAEAKKFGGDSKRWKRRGEPSSF